MKSGAIVKVIVVMSDQMVLSINLTEFIKLAQR